MFASASVVEVEAPRRRPASPVHVCEETFFAQPAAGVGVEVSTHTLACKCQWLASCVAPFSQVRRVVRYKIHFQVKSRSHRGVRVRGHTHRDLWIARMLVPTSVAALARAIGVGGAWLVETARSAGYVEIPALVTVGAPASEKGFARLHVVARYSGGGKRAAQLHALSGVIRLYASKLLAPRPGAPFCCWWCGRIDSGRRNGLDGWRCRCYGW